jgi:hypothetical protein
LEAVPVRPRPRIRTFMGTVRLHCRRSKSVSFVKTSVMGRREYLSAYDMMLDCVYRLGYLLVKQCNKDIKKGYKARQKREDVGESSTRSSPGGQRSVVVVKGVAVLQGERKEETWPEKPRLIFNIHLGRRGVSGYSLRRSGMPPLHGLWLLLARLSEYSQRFDKGLVEIGTLRYLSVEVPSRPPTPLTFPYAPPPATDLTRNIAPIVVRHGATVAVRPLRWLKHLPSQETRACTLVRDDESTNALLCGHRSPKGLAATLRPSSFFFFVLSRPKFWPCCQISANG